MSHCPPLPHHRLPQVAMDSAHHHAQQLYQLSVGTFTLDLTEYTATDHHGTTVWPAGETLCHYFHTQIGPAKLKGKHILELGSGTGILAILLAKLGASVTATDMDAPIILDNIRANASRNGVRDLIQIEPHNWGCLPAPTIDPHLCGHEWDYVIAADCVYTLEPLPLLLDSIQRLAGFKTTVLIAMERRDPYVSDQCVARAKELGFDVTKIPRAKLNKQVAHESMEVFRLKKRRV
ncbi:putative methyltransferase-domain-containing protein [Catenaria anguillulae PL171]|uniref:Putative methyltransferase-domain-containing protein n=1 Tax=Catenaria anguillulae PL171 TaxID=765915 RepID=A0A1Y2I1V8_9FUNG|nr:putative methyltransferase-domain-containing protein [Catenaria anguillulae PL171]